MSLRRSIGLALLAATLAAPVCAQNGEVDEAFRAGVTALRRGDDAEALAAFQRVLALDPSNEDAWALWQATEQDVWVDLLVKGGQFELIAKRLSDLARAGRAERQDDAEAIGALVEKALGDDVLERRRAVLALSSEHGEFAVPALLRQVGNPTADEKRVLAMQALAQMSTAVVPPLLEALESEDAFLRRNVALTLGYIGDPRAAGSLVWLSQSDPDGGVRQAALESARRCKAEGDALAHFLRDGDDYHNRRGRVLGENDYSSVVWSWTDGQLVAHPVPRWVYPAEMARKCYWRALKAAPTSVEARAGIARSWIDEQARAATLAAAGADVGEWPEVAQRGSLNVGAAGLDALDLALRWAVQQNDGTVGAPLAALLGDHAWEATPGLAAAMQSREGATRANAMLAAGRIAARTGQAASAEVVRTLGEIAAREIQRVAFVIDADAQRSAAIASALESEGFYVQTWNGGTKGLSMLRRVPAIDVVLVAETLPDLTAAQVIGELRSEPLFAQTPVLLIAADPAAAAETWEDRIQGALSDASGVGEVTASLSETMDGERTRADELAARAAQALAELARAGRSDLSAALPALGRASERRDGVAIPALDALASAGTQAQIPALIAVLADGGRSDEARIAASDALVGIFSRNGIQLGTEGLGRLLEVAGGDGSLAVRAAAARALGHSRIEPAARAEALSALRAPTGGAASE